MIIEAHNTTHYFNALFRVVQLRNRLPEEVVPASGAYNYIASKLNAYVVLMFRFSAVISSFTYL